MYLSLSMCKSVRAYVYVNGKCVSVKQTNATRKDGIVINMLCLGEGEKQINKRENFVSIECMHPIFVLRCSYYSCLSAFLAIFICLHRLTCQYICMQTCCFVLSCYSVWQTCRHNYRKSNSKRHRTIENKNENS